MLNKAIEKITIEMNKHKDDDFIPSIGEFLIYYLGINPWVAEKILNPEKDMAKIAPELWKAAKAKKKVNSVALTDKEVIPIVFKYFDIDSAITNGASIVQEQIVQAHILQEKKSIEFNVELDF